MAKPSREFVLDFLRKSAAIYDQEVRDLERSISRYRDPKRLFSKFDSDNLGKLEQEHSHAQQQAAVFHGAVALIEDKAAHS